MPTKKILLTAGYIILTALTLLLFTFALVPKLDQRLYLLALVHIFILAGLVYECFREGLAALPGWRLLKTGFSVTDFWNFIAVTAGAVATFWLSVNMALGPVVAAGLVGVITALIKPKYGVPAYCGAFVGMACPCYICNYLHLVIAGTAAGAIFVISKPFFNGFGGKLGTIAFAGCLLAGFSMGSPLQSLPVPDWDLGWLILAYAVAGALCTYLLSIPMKYGPVLASGVVGLTAGLVLPALHTANGNTLAVVVICSSFAGMSSKKRFPRTWLMVAAGVFAGMVYMFSLPYLGGAGGKLGTIAFGSVIALRGIIAMVKKVRRSYFRPKRRTPISP